MSLEHPLPLTLLYKYTHLDSSDQDLTSAVTRKRDGVLFAMLHYKDLPAGRIERLLLQQNLSPHYAKQEAQRILTNLHKYNEAYQKDLNRHQTTPPDMNNGEEKKAIETIELDQLITKELIKIRNAKRAETLRSDFENILEEEPAHLYSVLTFLEKTDLRAELFSKKPRGVFSFDPLPSDAYIEKLFTDTDNIFHLLKNEFSNTKSSSKMKEYQKQFVELFKLHFLNSQEVPLEWIARETYTLLVLFYADNLPTSLKNAENFLKINHIDDIGQLCQFLPTIPIDPTSSNNVVKPINLSNWQKIIQERPSLYTLGMFQWAKEIVENLPDTNNLAKKQSFFNKNHLTFDKIKTAYLKCIYGDSYQKNIQLADLCASLNVPESQFKKAMLVLSNYQQEIQQEDILPNILIDGKDIGHAKYFFVKLPKKDLLNLFIGEQLNTCHSIGKNGSAYVIDALLFKNRANYVLLKAKKEHLTFTQCYDKTNKIINHNLCRVVGFGYSFIGINQSLCIDSWENLHRPEGNDLKDDAIIVKFLEAFVEQAIHNFAFQRVTIGKGGKTPQRYKRMRNVEFPEVTSGGYQPQDSASQALLGENLLKKQEMAIKFNLPLEQFSHIISPLQFMMLEGLHKHYHQYFLDLLANEQRFVDLTEPQAFKTLFLRVYSDQTLPLEDLNQAKQDLRIMLDVADRQAIIKDFLTSSPDILSILVKKKNQVGKQALLTLAKEHSCLKMLFRNQNMMEVLSYADNHEQIAAYLKDGYVKEILYSAEKYRYPDETLLHYLTQEKEHVDILLRFLLNDVILSSLINIHDIKVVLATIEPLLTLAAQHSMLPEILMNLYYFNQKKWNISEFTNQQPVIKLILETAQRHNLLYKLISHGKMAYSIVLETAKTDPTITTLINQQIAEMLAQAFKDKNYRFVVEWGGFSEQSKKSLCDLINKDPRLLIELFNIPNSPDNLSSLKLRKLIVLLVKEQSITFDALEYVLKSGNTSEVYESHYKPLLNNQPSTIVNPSS